MTAYSIHILSCILHQSSSVVRVHVHEIHPLVSVGRLGPPAQQKLLKTSCKHSNGEELSKYRYFFGEASWWKKTELLARERQVDSPIHHEDRREIWWLFTYHWSCFWSWKNFALALSHQKVLHYLKVRRKEIAAPENSPPCYGTPSKKNIAPSLIR